MLTRRLSPPESSQHSRSQARVKEEGCVRFWQTSIKNSQGDRIILIWLVVGDSVLNVISAYAPQVGLSESTKR